MNQLSYDGKPSLYLVPTPIGNMEDITIRSLNILKMVDLILCEDTRETQKLLNYYDIHKKLYSCHQYNEDSIKSQIVHFLSDGKNIALVTDQGTPIISDPGYIVVKEIVKYGYNVIGLPGATAFVPALISSGIDSSHFLFYGFLSSKDSKQKNELKLLKDYPFTIIFYESPHRIQSTLENMLDVFGDRDISIAREISKIHEEVMRGKISDFLLEINQKKGEFVIIVDGNHHFVDFSSLSIIDHVKLYLDDGISEMEAIKKVAKERKISKAVVYKEYHVNK